MVTVSGPIQGDQGKKCPLQFKLTKACETFRKKGESLDKGDDLLSLSSECPHPTLMKDMCAQCGKDLRKMEEASIEPNVDVASTSRGQNKASIAMVHSIPELKVSSDVSFA